MFGAYCDLLQRLAKDDEVWYPPQRSLLPPAQLKQRIAVNATDKPIPETALLHTLVFQQVSLRPEQRAVVTSDRTLTYLEVGDRAIKEAIANVLEEQGNKSLIGYIVGKDPALIA